MTRNYILHVKIFVRAYHTGVGLPDSIEKNFKKSDEIYEKLIDDRIEIGTPVYSLLEYRAEINMKGGFGLQKNPQMAAELYEAEFGNPRIKNNSIKLNKRRCVS